MEARKKLLAALVAAGVLGVGTFAVAQPGAGYCDGPMATMGGMKGGGFDPGARADQRLNRLKADLKLNAQQEPLWQAFAERMKAEAGKGWQGMRDTAQDLSLSAPERMSRMTGIMKERVAAMESVNESFKRLYDALTPDQKRVADIHAARMAGAGGMRGHHGPMHGMGGMSGMSGMSGMTGMGGMGRGMPPPPPAGN